MGLTLPRPDRGLLLVVSGPSGVGKTTLVRHVLAEVPDLAFSVSATTRAPRPGERHGVDYLFVQEETYAAMAAAGGFLEHARVYGNGYGTPAAPVEEALAQGRSVLLDIDAQGSAQVRVSKPEAVHVMILPPSFEVLERRLTQRGTDSSAAIERRMRDAGEQVLATPGYDYVVVNDDLQAACAQLLGVVCAELARTSRHASRVASLIDDVRRRNG